MGSNYMTSWKRQNDGKNKKISDWDFPSSPVVKIPSSKAGGVSLISDQGTINKIPHAPEYGQKLK